MLGKSPTRQLITPRRRVYYGKQEQIPAAEIRDKFAKLTTQVIKMKQQGKIIITGDFNAKIALLEDGSIQKEGRNGKIMAEFIENTGLTPISTKPQHGLWMRENRHKPNEKSVIDYVLTTPILTGQTKNLNIDEEGTLRMQGRKESDHNTITYEVTGKIRKNVKRKWIWRPNNEDAWNNFNKVMENARRHSK